MKTKLLLISSLLVAPVAQAMDNWTTHAKPGDLSPFAAMSRAIVSRVSVAPVPTPTTSAPSGLSTGSKASIAALGLAAGWLVYKGVQYAIARYRTPVKKLNDMEVIDLTQAPTPELTPAQIEVMEAMVKRMITVALAQERTAPSVTEDMVAGIVSQMLTLSTGEDVATVARDNAQALAELSEQTDNIVQTMEDVTKALMTKTRRMISMALEAEQASVNPTITGILIELAELNEMVKDIEAMDSAIEGNSIAVADIHEKINALVQALTDLDGDIEDNNRSIGQLQQAVIADEAVISDAGYSDYEYETDDGESVCSADVDTDEDDSDEDNAESKIAEFVRRMNLQLETLQEQAKRFPALQSQINEVRGMIEALETDAADSAEQIRKIELRIGILKGTLREKLFEAGQPDDQ